MNGEAIYGSGPTPFADAHGDYNPTKLDKKGQPTWVPKWDWRATTKPGKIFIHLFEWPGTTFTLSGLKGAVTGAYLLADRGTPLKVSQAGENLSVSAARAGPGPAGLGSRAGNQGGQRRAGQMSLAGKAERVASQVSNMA